MNEPYADEAPMRRVGPLLILLVAAVGLVLVAIAVLSDFWDVAHTPDWKHAGELQGKAPALETTPQSALQEYLASKHHIANSYTWIDPVQHLAHIPVEAAMRALAAQTSVAPDQWASYLMGIQEAQGQNPGKAAAARELQSSSVSPAHAGKEDKP